MLDDSLGTILIIVVLVLLILDIIIAILILRILFSIHRFMNLVDQVVDDIEKLSRVVKQVSFPKSVSYFIKTVAKFLPDTHSKNDKTKN